MRSSFHVTLTDLPSRGDLERLWIELQSRCSHSFYTSWGWVGSWLHALPPDIVPQLLQVSYEGRIVGAAVFNKHRMVRGNVISSRGLYLNETGDETCDAVFIEHNGLLAERGLESRIWQEVFEFLQNGTGNWDEFYAGGIDSDDPLSELIQKGTAFPDARWTCIREKPCHYVDLASLQIGKKDYLTTLSSNTRSQVRRAIKLYTEQGPVQVEEASDLPTAMRMFDEMKVAHTAYWQSQGEPGAFTSSFSDRMHRVLITERFPCGEVQLLRVQVGEQAIGYLYNFAYEGRILSYQSGFQYSDNPKLKPGLVSHTLAVEHYASRGFQVYDFLAGDSQYKRMLAHSAKSMHWYILRRNRMKFRVEAALRSVKRFCMK